MYSVTKNVVSMLKKNYLNVLSDDRYEYSQCTLIIEVYTGKNDLHLKKNHRITEISLFQVCS